MWQSLAAMKIEGSRPHEQFRVHRNLAGSDVLASFDTLAEAGALIGISAADLVGTASNLHSPGDIAGIYSAIGAGLSVAGGRTAAQLSNANGVVLRLHGRQIGFSFSIDLAGMSISLA
jgi:hypothetical protein